ncbi:MAG TPA: amidohydrolase family protein [Acidimicrobiia bacterium]|nr:amidohydrolase family protein [Acidimicrobiia bacterium]
MSVRADDLILVSVDDHICEPADMFDAHVPEKYRAYTPRVVDEPDGSQQWYYGEVRGRNLGLNAVAGKPPEMFNVNPSRYEDMRPGCYDVHERVRDMAAGGQLAGLNFPNWTGFAGQVLNLGPDRDVNLVMIRAYNDWHVDEWCAAQPDRFIPCGILPLFDAEEAATEIRRLAAKGCHAVTFSENPAGLGMPSIHTDAWDPLFAACCDEGTVLCCHVGSSSKGASTVPDAPPPVPMNLSSTMSIYTLGDLLWADFWHRFPELRFALSEGDIGWIPYFLQRGEHTLDRHNAWMGHRAPQGKGPTELFRERIVCCFINDPVGIELLDHFNLDNVCWESDYPHSDSMWPRAPERLAELLAGSSADVVAKITHENAMRHFRFDPFATRPREQCTVAALRAEAADVDTVTHVGRRADETDVAAWKAMTGAAAKASR